MIQVVIVFDSEDNWETFPESEMFEELIAPIISTKACRWLEIRDFEE